MRVNVPLNVAVDVGTPSVCVPDPNDTITRQRYRLFQAVFVGPLMVYGGTKTGGWSGTALALLGLGAMWYGARDYARIRESATPVPGNLPQPPPGQ